MNIQQAAENLNEKAFHDGFKIAQLPELRKRYLGKKQLPSKIFTKHTIFDGDDQYAFHHGGRDEMQFNFGEEIIDDEPVTRYALCFSLEASRSLPNPIEDLEPFRIRFNQCLETNYSYFESFQMWYYQWGQRYGNFIPQKISDEWFQYGNFISLGNIINKPISDLTEYDLTEILKGFDKLLPIYKFCVLQIDSIPTNERRISKICWNENDWMSPSGKTGKSFDNNSYERSKGFGHEEWLFDFEKLVDDYHYAALQSVERGRVTFYNKKFDVRLYSHNSATNENLWIGSIKDLEVISPETSKLIYSHYKERGWFDEMGIQIKSANGNFQHFKNLKPHEYFNVRFKPENAVLNKPYKKIEYFKRIIGTYRYQFIYDFEITSIRERKKSKRRNFIFKSGKTIKSLENRVSTRQKKIIQSEPLHDKIQKILYEQLLNIYSEENVGMETDTGLATRIDVSVSSADGVILYEVKSYPSVMITIRVAIGQLLEYGYYPNPIENLVEMIIVSHIPIDEESKEYLEFLRTTTSLKIFYQSVNLRTRLISDKY
jgi:hypothetical protein